MKTHGSALVLVCLLAGARCVLAGEPPCPKDFKTEQKLLLPVKGWDVFEDPNLQHHFLTAVSFYDGPPKEMADLVPDDPEAKGGQVWTFALGAGAGHGVWQVCRYSGTSLSLSRKLEPSVKSCKVRYGYQSPREVESVVCK